MCSKALIEEDSLDIFLKLKKNSYKLLIDFNMIDYKTIKNDGIEKSSNHTYRFFLNN